MAITSDSNRPASGRRCASRKFFIGRPATQFGMPSSRNEPSSSLTRLPSTAVEAALDSTGGSPSRKRSAMKTLLILRHGKSSWHDEKLADYERPLSPRGKESARLIGRLLKKKKLLPDGIVTSTAVRARKTAAKVAKEIDFKGA